MIISILFENDEYVVVNKPAGILVHPDGHAVGPTLTDWLVEKYPNMRDVGESQRLANGEVVARPGIVHRLDRDTSGVLVIAKTPTAFTYLKERFADRDVKKRYEAFVYGRVKEDEGRIDRPIARSRSDFRRWSAQRGARGQARPAVTDYHVRGRLADDFTFLELEPHTGRTHQIRVHLKAINHPVICDTLYAPTRPAALGFQRLALHARAIHFTDAGGNDIAVEAPYPADFEAAIAKIPRA